MKQKLLSIGAILVLSACSVFAQETKLWKSDWKAIAESEIPTGGTRYIKPTKYQAFELNLESMAAKLAQVKRLDHPNYIPITIQIPRPDGTLATFEVFENETMSIGLAEKFPEIRAFDGKSLDGTGEIAKFDLTPQGFHAMIMVPGASTIFLDPYAHLSGDLTHYIVYDRAHFESTDEFECHFENPALTEVKEGNEVTPVKSLGNCTKRTYRLALNATGEYTTFHGGTVVLAQAAQVTTMNRVNGVYMRDVAVTMTIVANNNLLIYTNATTDPFANGTPGTMINQSHTNCNTVIGSANYDIGHVFGTNSGGLAGLGVVCSNTNKGRGVTGSGAPVGDPFDIDYVAHEMGHQFSGNHTFSGNTGSCSGNGNAGTAVEPGSGSSIMAYAGICSPNDIQPNSDDHFVFASMQEIHTFLAGGGNSCAVSTVIPGQSAPTVTIAGGSYSIPISTPFALTASATDPDGDVLTYCWEQNNATLNVNVPTATQTAGPNFRSRTPSTNPTRYFPSIASLSGGAASPYEVLPSVARTMTFKCLVRDNELGGGCNDEETVTMTTVASAGPFVVTFPTATGVSVAGNSSMTVTWSVNNTNIAPVSCANADILVSTNGGTTWTLVGNDVPNDGSEVITVPNVASTQALVMVMCANGTFFDVSNNVFTITAATNDYSLSLISNSISSCQGTDATFNVTVGQIGTFSTPVVLSTTGLPGGAVASFSPGTVTPAGSSVLTITTGAVPPGTYPFTINGNAAGNLKQVSATLSVSNSTISPSTLTAPADNSIDQAVATNLTWTNAGAGLLYTVDIASDAGFATIVETATGITATNYTATLLAPATQYFWRVSAYNSCTSPVASGTFDFTTASCQNYAYTGAPVVISSSGTPTITSTINITDFGTINDLNVADLAGTHTWVNDLSATLTSPTGTVVTLWANICSPSTAVAGFDLKFDDEAASATLPCPPTDGLYYQSSQALSAFDGEEMNGTWTLTMSDAFNQDGGQLDSWALDLCFTPSTPCNNPTTPTLSGTTAICAGGNTTLSVATGTLNDATDWQWYSGSCGGTSVGSGTTFNATAAGTYFVRGEGGCVTPGTCTSITVTQTNVNNATTTSGSTITATQTGATYQWVTCPALTPISGATSQSFTATANGQYAVNVTVSGCTSTSACVTIAGVGLDENVMNASLFPNPTSGTVTVQFANELNLETIVVTDVTGRIIRSSQNITTQNYEVDLTHEAKGIYYVNFAANGTEQTLRIIKN
jgi:subtilisin-like proprotein convertase family protein